MSTTVSSGVWQCGPEDQAQAFVLLAIADNADDFGFAFPSHQTIAQKSRCDVRTVIRRIDQLEGEGWLRVGRKMNGRGNVYFIDLGKIGVTVSPMARKSPLFMRLEKVAGDRLSRIFLPKSLSDTKKFSGDNPQPLQVTKADPQVTPATSQVTKTPLSGDKSCHTNRHQPPPLEPSTEPSGEPSADAELTPTPLQGVEGAGWKDLAASMRGAIAEQPDEGSAAQVSPDRQEQFGCFRRQLQEDLGSVPPNIAMRRFSEIEAGQNDFDACFREWWLLDVRIERVGRRSPGVESFTVITGSEKPEATRKGFEKYGPRMQHRARQHFGLPPQTTVRFVVADANANEQSAA